MTKNQIRTTLMVVTILATIIMLGFAITLPKRCDNRCKEANPEWERHVVWGTWSPCQCKDAEGNLKVP